MEFDTDLIVKQIIELVVQYSPRLLMALLTLTIGWKLINLLRRVTRKALDRKSIDEMLKGFLDSLISAVLKILLLISVASMVGIETTSFVAMLGAAGLAVGLALQGSLANFAGGVLILIFRPFKVGDYIEAAGHGGTVTSIQIFSSVLTTPDNCQIVIPNGSVVAGSIKNYSALPTRRVDYVFGIGYGDSISKAREILLKLIREDSRIHKDPEPVIVVGELGDNSVNLTVRVWANASDYWDLKFDLTEKAKIAFDENGISIPFPQRDVHLHTVTN